MPLIKSPTNKAFKANLQKEVEAGKPLKQALAISYSTQRAAARKQKKRFSKGGIVDELQSSESPKSLADAILQRRKAATQDVTQESDTSLMSDESGNDALLQENYDDTELTDVTQAQDESEDGLSIADKIRRRLRGR